MAASTVVSEVTIPPVVASSQEQPRHKKLVNVTVTILSIAGLFLEDVGAGTKKRGGIMAGNFSIRNSKNGSSGFGSPSRKIKTDESASETDSSTLTASTSRDSSAVNTSTSTSATKVVASLSRVIKNKNVMVHLSSMPLTVPETNDKGRSAKKNSEMNAISSVVQWLEQQEEDSPGYKQREPSSYQFQLAFHAEYSTAKARFVPQLVPIQISISRFGRMYKIGTAQLLVSGEENGDSSIAVPVTSCYHFGTLKSNKFKGILSGSLTKSTKDKAMRMLALKGDTLKCGLDPNATLRVLVHVSEPICETLEISPKLNVTMIPSNVQAKMSPTRPEPTTRTPTPKEEPESQQADGTTADNDVPSDIWEYNPILATIVVNRPDYGINDANNGSLFRVVTESEDYDDNHDHDEPSCSSSAYMSAIDENRYPSKHGMSTRSSSTATMTTTSSVSILSDLTDGHSWLSQTGIEVIPYSAFDPVNEQVRLQSISHDVKADNEYDSVSEDSASEETHTTEISFGRASTTSSHIIHPSTTKAATKSWHQRLACGLPVCGADVYNDSTKSVSAVKQYGSMSPNWLRMTGKCESLVDHDYDEDSSSSESSSDS
ncbi:hypothetical protein ACHAXH_002736 [Discostella pseudostelligera]